MCWFVCVTGFFEVPLTEWAVIQKYLQASNKYFEKNILNYFAKAKL
jgi:hypothetical protein